MTQHTRLSLKQFDREHIWHPYSSATQPLTTHQVQQASGVNIELASGESLIDAMASWWSVIHGYNHPTINAAATHQIEQFAHVMFGGLTHEPAIQLCQKLIDITPVGLTKVFLSDSGSVAVEVAMKMAIQYWRESGKASKQKFVALRGGYHGDTLGAMSVCDPDTGMHHLFGNALPRQYFIERPDCRFGETCDEGHLEQLRNTLADNHKHIAALILEPVVQGAGGMYFYSPEYLRYASELCREYDVLLIADEIATGFGRTGKLFACEHANISPDIICVGKALTGGYLSLAATLCSDKVAEGICSGEAGVFMHGPTFMGNPLACAIASTSLELLLNSDWENNIQRIEKTLKSQLLELNQHNDVTEARCLGAIGVIEAKRPVDMHKVQQLLPELGVWLRPFGRLVYTMPPYIMTDNEINKVCNAMRIIVEECC